MKSSTEISRLQVNCHTHTHTHTCHSTKCKANRSAYAPVLIPQHPRRRLGYHGHVRTLHDRALLTHKSAREFHTTKSSYLGNLLATPDCVRRSPLCPCACVLRLLPVAAAEIGKCQAGAGSSAFATITADPGPPSQARAQPR